MRKSCFLIFSLFISYNGAAKPKSVNLALETVLEFHNKDKIADVKFLDDVQNFIYKLKSVINTNNTSRRFDSNTRDIKFTDFIKNVIDILKTYDDEDLEDIFAVFDGEIRKYHYRGCKFYELVEDQVVRRFVANKLNDVKDKPAAHIRKYLDEVTQAIEDARFSSRQTLLLDYINSLYTHDSNEKLKAFIYNLQTYRSKSKRATLNLMKVVKDGVRSVIFDHYSNLNANARRDLKIRLETNWKDDRWPGGVDHRVFTINYKSNPLKRDKKIKFIDLEEHTSELEARTRSTKRDATIIEKTTTSVYKKKHRHRNREVSNEGTTKKNRHHKKISSFITLYPEEINTNKIFKIQNSTKHIRMLTLWEEKIKPKKHKRKDERFKMKRSRDEDIPRHILSSHDTVINVKRTRSNENDDFKHNKSKDLKTERVETKTKKHRKHKSKSTTMKRFRKQLSITSPLVSEEGISIEVNEIKRRSMMTTQKTEIEPSAHIELKRNVLRRINNLEKQMEEVKFKIDTTQTTTEIEPLQFWEGTTTGIKIITTATATPTTTTSTTPTTAPTTIPTTTPSTAPTTTTTTTKSTTNEVKSSSTTKLSSKHTTEITSKITTISKTDDFEEKTDTTISKINNSEEKTDTAVNIPKPNEKSAIDFDNMLNNLTTSGENDKQTPTNTFEGIPGNDLIEVDKDIDIIMKKYNLTNKESNTSNDIENLLRNMKPEEKKIIDLNEGIENETKDVAGKDEAEFNDPLQDINAALDLL